MMNAVEAVNEHIRALLARDMEALVDGYADDAVILVGTKAIAGKPAIRGMFGNLPEAGVLADVTVDPFVSHGDHVFVTYRRPGQEGGDTFTVRNGKITMQSVHIVHR